ncbi:hypothetical protein BRC77_05815 [Halobacteriales archaeon QH_8_64_26]|nr:MAG: hypothetical protein BRC77_05815 [Halobacteriales archaeon QH_8_64_26]
MTRFDAISDDFDASVPVGETPRARCPYCERPFRAADLCALHIGQVHREECTEAEREDYDDAYDAESDALFLFQLKAVAMLVVLSLGLTYTYAVVWT